MIAIIVGVTTACCHVAFNQMGYDILLTTRWNQDLKAGINYKEKLEYKIFGSDNLLGNTEGRIKKQLAGY
jgi:hypothetical protein